MREGDVGVPVAPSRRTVLTGGVVLTALTAGVGVVLARGRTISMPVAAPAAAPTAAPVPAATQVPALPTLSGPAITSTVLHPASGANMQCFVPLAATGEWFVTQAVGGTSNWVDQSGWAVGDIVVSRLAQDGSLLDAMTLPDSGHGMGLVVRIENGVHVLYTCWFAAGTGSSLYDVVRIPYSPGIAARTAATTVATGSGYPLDPSYDSTIDAVTLRHQGGGGPDCTRHAWTDFAAGDLTKPIGQIPTPDTPPTHQGFCSLGDRFFFLTGAASTQIGGDPALITEYDWRTAQVVGTPLDASGNSRLANGTYPGGSMEPEGAAIQLDASGAASLLVGVSNGPEAGSGGHKVERTFRYPFASA